MEAYDALGRILRKSRMHFYKPIQIAEILFRHRTLGDIDLRDVETYRNASKHWRDAVSARLIGRVCTSSQRFQDNLFDENAMPPRLLVRLGDENTAHAGRVEAFIYRSMEAKLQVLADVRRYVSSARATTFALRDLESRFTRNPGLRRSIDKLYEIVVYALFATLVRALRAEVTLRIGNRDRRILQDFAKFLSAVLGLRASETERTFPAALHRLGVTNAADSGLDMWTNFGPAVQVKHLTLTADLVEDIAERLSAERIVIVCRDADPCSTLRRRGRPKIRKET